MKKAKNYLSLIIKGLLYIYVPVISLLFIINAFFLKINLANSIYRMSVFLIYSLLVSFLFAIHYSTKTIEKNIESFAQAKELIAKGKWQVLEESKNRLLVKPNFDFPFRLVIDSKVELEHLEEKTIIKGPRYYADNIIKDMEKKPSFLGKHANSITRLLLIILLVSIPLANELKVSWSIKENRHNSFVEDVKILDIDSDGLLGNSPQNTNNYGQGLESKDYFFYVEEGLSLVRTNKDFGEKTYLIQKPSGHSIDTLNLIGDWIYYQDENLKRIKIDGSDGEIIYKAGPAYDLHLKDNYLYFINPSDNWNVYKMDINGRNLQRLLEIDAADITIHEDKMLVSHYGDYGSYVESINLDGTGRKIEFEAKANQLTFWDDFYYFVGEDYKLYKTDALAAPELLIDSKISSYYITDNGIFYSLHSDEWGYPGKNIYKIGLDGKNNRLIQEVLQVEGFTKLGNSILFHSWEDNSLPILNKLDIFTSEIESMDM